MRCTNATAILLATAVLLSLSGAATELENSVGERPAAATDANAVRAVVEAMNQAISDGDLPRLVELFADGAVNVDLFPAHSFDGAPPAGAKRVEAVDLADRWRTIGPILFSSTASYTRRVADMAIHVDKDLALAWADIETRMSPLGEGAQVQTNRFKEICILRHDDEGWRIVAVTKNRQDAQP